MSETPDPYAQGVEAAHTNQSQASAQRFSAHLPEPLELELCTDRDRQWAKEKAVIACEHIMHIKQVSGSANETATAICSKCGYEPYP